MAARITRAEIDERCANVNRRLRDGRPQNRPGDRLVIAQSRNGYIGLDEYVVSDRKLSGMAEGTHALDCQRTLTTGTKREVGDFLHAMMVGIDLSRVVDDPSFFYAPETDPNQP